MKIKLTCACNLLNQKKIRTRIPLHYSEYRTHVFMKGTHISCISRTFYIDIKIPEFHIDFPHASLFWTFLLDLSTIFHESWALGLCKLCIACWAT